MQNNSYILVVEDQPELTEIIVEILENEGLNVIAVSNAIEAIALLENSVPDLIISDIIMPHLSGFEFKENLLKNSRLASVPFVFLSAKISRDDITKAINLGADDYIKKPFDVQDFISIVHSKIRKTTPGKAENGIYPVVLLLTLINDNCLNNINQILNYVY
jgi:CheY-like chemotaxis protein